MVQLCYADRLLSDVQREFRDRYKNDLISWRTASSSTAVATGMYPAFNNYDFKNFKKVFDGILGPLEEEDRQAKFQPRYYCENLYYPKLFYYYYFVVFVVY